MYKRQFLILFLPVQSLAMTLIWVVYGYVALSIIDAVIMSQRMHKAMQRKFGTVQRLSLIHI